MAVTGSMWLLQGLCDCYRVYVALTAMCHVDLGPISFTFTGEELR